MTSAGCSGQVDCQSCHHYLSQLQRPRTPHFGAPQPPQGLEPAVLLWKRPAGRPGRGRAVLGSLRPRRPTRTWLGLRAPCASQAGVSRAAHLQLLRLLCITNCPAQNCFQEINTFLKCGLMKNEAHREDVYCSHKDLRVSCSLVKDYICVLVTSAGTRDGKCEWQFLLDAQELAFSRRTAGGARLCMWWSQQELPCRNETVLRALALEGGPPSVQRSERALP